MENSDTTWRLKDAGEEIENLGKIPETFCEYLVTVEPFIYDLGIRLAAH